MRPTPALLALLVTAGVSGPAPASAQAATSSTPIDSVTVRLGPGDAVRLEVFPSRGLFRAEGLALPEPLSYDVDADGNVLLPVAGLVRVVDRPFDEVRAEVEQAFREEFVDARVRLIPLLRIAVLGEVRLPGLLPVDPTMAVADVVAAAGGLTENANHGDIRHIRGGVELYRTSIEEVVEIRTPLRTRDQIVVGRRSWVSRNAPILVGAAASVVASVLTALIVR